MRKLGRIFRKVWSGEGIPEDWKRALMVSLYKKGDKERTGNYRGISLLGTAYKLYTDILRKRLEKEMERQVYSRRSGRFSERKGNDR